MADDLTKLWAGRDHRTGEIHPAFRMGWRDPARFPFKRAESRAELPIFRAVPLVSVLSRGTTYPAQDFPNPDMVWDNPSRAEYERWMARYRDDVSADRRRARDRAIASVLGPPLTILLLPLAILAKIANWAYSR